MALTASSEAPRLRRLLSFPLRSCMQRLLFDSAGVKIHIGGKAKPFC
jgi:hypothetical protein